MTIEIIGYIRGHKSSEIHPADGPVANPEWIRSLARAHEEGGFDRVLIGFRSFWPESQLIASLAASVTDRLKFLIAHRPGFTQPTLFARQFATFDQLWPGRAAVNIVTGGSDAELQQDGDFLAKEDRYLRTGEFLEIAGRIWAETQPFDHEGRFYRAKGAVSLVRPHEGGRIPVYFGGASDAAIAIAAEHADVYAFWGEPLAQSRELIARVRTAAARHRRNPGFSASFRPIIAATEEAAWARARQILERAADLHKAAGGPARTSEGSRRLVDAARLGDRQDKVLWTGISALTGGAGNTAALVGTPEQVADAVADYHDIGVTTVLFRGFDPLEDAIAYGRDLVPAIRARVAGRAAAHATHAA